MVWDSTDGYGFLFGGEYINETTDRTQYYNDSWTYVRGAWTNVTGGAGPSQRFGFGLADDPGENGVLLFGGASVNATSHETVYENDTWLWSDAHWTNLTATAGTAPPAGFWLTMAYDNATASVILFGGINKTSQYGNDTWSFSDGKWSQLFPSTLPPGRHGQMMAYDPVDEEMVLFGGVGEASYLNDTWTFQDGTWAPIEPGFHPDERQGGAMTFDYASNTIVMFGGYPSPSYFYTTWLFVGGVWTSYNLTWNPVNPTDPYQQMIFDPVDGYAFLFYEPDGEGPLMGDWALRYTEGPSPLTATLAAHPSSIALGGVTLLNTSASGGSGTYSYAYSTLPPGCASEDTDSLACTPSSTGSFVIGVNVTDTSSDHASAVTDLTVTGAPPPQPTASLSAAPANLSVDRSTVLTVATSGFSSTALTYAFASLPPGCTTANSSELPCSPTAAGTFHPTVLVTDASGQSARASTTVNVTASGGSTPAGSTSGTWIWIAIGVIALAVVLLIVFVARRRRKEPPASPPPASLPPPAPPST